LQALEICLKLKKNPTKKSRTKSQVF